MGWNPAIRCQTEIGWSGVQLLCTANDDSAKVKLYIGRKDNAENKRLFDFLLARKVEIEAAYGRELTWNRSEETRSSSIEDELEGVRITQETDWPRMAQFHAVQAARLLKAVEGYLKGFQ